MKRIMSILIIGMSLAALDFAWAKDFDFTIRGTLSIYQDRDLREDGKGVRGEFSWKGVYAWGSFEQLALRLTGQRAGEIRLYGVGLGTKIKIVKGLTAFGEFGYYIPDSDLQKSPEMCSDGLEFYWVRTLKEIDLNTPYFRGFNQYKYELKSGAGASLGLDFKQELYKGLSVNFFGAYRFLNLMEDYDAYNPAIPGCYIQTKDKRSFSGGVFGIGLNYAF